MLSARSVFVFWVTVLSFAGGASAFLLPSVRWTGVRPITPNLSIRLRPSHTVGLQTCMTSSVDEFRNRQWELFIKNHGGTWVGSTSWYDRDKETDRLDFSKPSEVIESCYEISFSDADTGSWKATGLRNVNGSRTLPLSRATYNANGNVWQFPGAGGLGSLTLDFNGQVGAKHMHEVYFFDGKVGSMIMTIYAKRGQDKVPGKLVLQSVSTMPFRDDKLDSKGGGEHLSTVAAILGKVAGWRGTRTAFGPREPLDERAVPCGVFDPQPYLSAPVAAALADHLLLAVPESVERGPARLVYGCLQTPGLFKQVSVDFDSDGRLSRWTHDVYTKPEIMP